MPPIARQQRSLGTLLIERGMLTRPQLEAALDEQKKTGEKLGRVLVRLNFVRERDIIMVMQGLMAVVFGLAGEEFAVESLLVREIIRFKQAVPLPAAPPYMEGLIHYRSKVVPVINMRARFSLPKREPDDSTRIIIFEDPGRQVGLLVDEVNAVLQIPRDRVEDAPQGRLGIPGHLIYALARLDHGVVTVLGLEALLAYTKPIAFTQEGA